MSSLVIAGETSGAITVRAPDVAGTSVLSLPAATDTLIGKATTDVLTNKSISGATNTLSNIGNAALSFDGGAFGFRNKIIGGDFTTNPWQRGTSFTAPASTAYTADRFQYQISSTAVVNILKTADAPTAAQAGVFTQHCLHLDVTTADASIAAGDSCGIEQNIEGLNAASFGFGRSGTRYVTLSFWHKHTKTGTYCASLCNNAGDRSYVVEYTQNVTDTWEKATTTIPIDTTGTWLYDTGIGVRCRFSLAAGSTFQTTANTWVAGNFLATANQVNALDNVANNFKLALIQLEAGSVATPFEARGVGTELALCERYYQKHTMTSRIMAVGYNPTTTSTRHIINFSTTMRIAPTAMETTGTAANYRIIHGNTATACSAVPTFGAASQYVAEITGTVASGLTAGQGCFLAAADLVTAYLAWSAEL